MRAGQVEPEVGGAAGRLDRLRTAGEQDVEDVAPGRLLLAGQVVAGQLEPLGQRGHGVVGGPQDRQPGRADLVGVAAVSRSSSHSRQHAER